MSDTSEVGEWRWSRWRWTARWNRRGRGHGTAGALGSGARRGLPASFFLPEAR